MSRDALCNQIRAIFGSQLSDRTIRAQLTHKIGKVYYACGSPWLALPSEKEIFMLAQAHKRTFRDELDNIKRTCESIARERKRDDNN